MNSKTKSAKCTVYILRLNDAHNQKKIKPDSADWSGIRWADGSVKTSCNFRQDVTAPPAPSQAPNKRKKTNFFFVLTEWFV